MKKATKKHKTKSSKRNPKPIAPRTRKFSEPKMVDLVSKDDEDSKDKIVSKDKEDSKDKEMVKLSELLPMLQKAIVKKSALLAPPHREFSSRLSEHLETLHQLHQVAEYSNIKFPSSVTLRKLHKAYQSEKKPSQIHKLNQKVFKMLRGDLPDDPATKNYLKS